MDRLLFRITQKITCRYGQQTASEVNYLLLLSFFLCFFASFSGFAQNEMLQSGRIESEYKLAVPEEVSSELWSFLAKEYSNEKVAEWDNRLSSSSSLEVFYDIYFDTTDRIMLKNQSGARFRQRYINDVLAKELVQLKLPTGDSTGVARIERKYNFYDKKKKSDRQAMHPFWQYIRPKDREEINLQLAPYKIKGNDLAPTIKVKQDRRRVYFQENGEALLTITLDKVRSFYFPYSTFTEVELELNEVRYTNSDNTERQRLEALNAKIKNNLLTNFPMLQQDQTPKYNKMHQLVKDSFLATIYEQFHYIVLGVLVLVATWLYFSVGYNKNLA